MVSLINWCQLDVLQTHYCLSGFLFCLMFNYPDLSIYVDVYYFDFDVCRDCSFLTAVGLNNQLQTVIIMSASINSLSINLISHYVVSHLLKTLSVLIFCCAPGISKTVWNVHSHRKLVLWRGARNTIKSMPLSDCSLPPHHLFLWSRCPPCFSHGWAFKAACLWCELHTLLDTHSSDWHWCLGGVFPFLRARGEMNCWNILYTHMEYSQVLLNKVKGNVDMNEQMC